jgi:hypothetical protein
VPLPILLVVRKVVPTLTSTSAEIYLSKAGAKKLSDTRFILVPAGAVHPEGGCSRNCIALHRSACRGELQARRERRRNLQVPEVRLRQSANIVSVGRNVQVFSYPPPPPRLGDRPPFYRPRGGGLQSCRVVLIMCGGMAYSAVELMAVLANLAPAGRHGVSCSRLGAASRVVVWELPVWSPSVR